MKITPRPIVSFLASLLLIGLGTRTWGLDVLSYQLELHPNIPEQSVRGQVTIQFLCDRSSLTMAAGALVIDEVTGGNVKSYQKVGSNLQVELVAVENGVQELVVSYHGKPRQGLIFDTKKDHAYTVYFTSQWMVCNEEIHDRASISMDIVTPSGKECIASGELSEQLDQGTTTLHRWQQGYETPAYTYGFAIGSFEVVREEAGEARLTYYGAGIGADTLRRLFEETPTILKFLEEKSGIPYVQRSYSQVVIGSHYQEMSGFAVLSEAYVASVLKDSSEIHLTTHELAHQWWGNMITCRDLSHFWLNEAFAVYMASAFHERRFGREKYLSDIALYKNIYDRLIERGQDKPLIMSRWVATRDNRHVVYYKGAYVLHLLREHLDDEPFWAGIKLYSSRYFGRSVETADFQRAMEDASGSDLSPFFEQWVYGLPTPSSKH
ncbi:MAG: M1 family aminopeptidase [Bacteroidota bacterium]